MATRAGTDAAWSFAFWSGPGGLVGLGSVAGSCGPLAVSDFGLDAAAGSPAATTLATTSAKDCLPDSSPEIVAACGGDAAFLEDGCVAAEG